MKNSANTCFSFCIKYPGYRDISFDPEKDEYPYLPEAIGFLWKSSHSVLFI
ncbi:MAG: hypothetical protein LBK96_03300 [Prevotellaceae bacterium]|nr:hypothetical protein [Prevotellaceae bacterium]